MKSVICLMIIICAASFSRADWSLVETITLEGDVATMDLCSDGDNLIVASANMYGGGYHRSARVFDIQGRLVDTHDLGTNVVSGITYNGVNVVLCRSVDYWASSKTNLWELNMQTGLLSGPLTPDLRNTCGWVNGLGYNGTDILITDGASGSQGILSFNVNLFNAKTYYYDGLFSVTVDTGTNISGTQVYGSTWYNGDFFFNFNGISKVYQYRPGHGIVDEILLPSLARGMTFIGDELYVAELNGNEIFRFVPEPCTLLLLGLGGLLIRRK